MRQSILGNTFIATAGRFANTFLGVLAIGIVSRLLGVSLYGTYALIFSYGTLWQIAADSGLYLTLTKSLVKDATDRHFLIGHTVGLRLALLLTAFALGIGVAAYVAPLSSHLLPLVIVAVGLSFQSLSQLIMGVFQYQAIIWRATIADIGGRLAQIAGLVLITSLQPSALLEWAAGWFTLSAVVTYGINWWLLPAPRVLVPRFSWNVWGNIIVKTWPFALLLILNVIYFRIDIVMLGSMRSAQEVGWYGLAYRIIENGLFFPAMMGGLLLPRLVAAFKNQQSLTICALLKETTHIMALVGGLIGIVLWQEAPGIVTVISGPSFAPAGSLLSLLSIALVVMLFGNIAGFGLVAFGREKFLVGLYAVLLLVNITGNYLLIPHFGAVGAAWMTVITEILSTVSAMFVIARLYPYLPNGWFILRTGIVIVSILLIWAVLPLSWHVLTRIMAGIALYGLLAGIAGLLDRRHFTLLLSRA